MLAHIVFEVPDNEIIDNRLDSTTKYLSLNSDSGELKVREVSGYVEPFNPINFDKVSIDTAKIEDSDVIIFKYPAEVLPEEANLVKDILSDSFPNNKVLGISSDIQLMEQNPKEAIEMLNRMIAHIKIVNI